MEIIDGLEERELEIIDRLEESSREGSRLLIRSNGTEILTDRQAQFHE